MPQGKSAAEAGPRPPCECHDLPMNWLRNPTLHAGGSWRCSQRYKATAKAWRDANRPHLRDYMTRWSAEHPGKRRTYMYGWRYGTTEAEHDAMFEAQRGLCAICELPAAESAKGVLHIDHNHATGRVRGLLCNRCNSAIERLDAVPDWLARAERYLK